MRHPIILLTLVAAFAMFVSGCNKQAPVADESPKADSGKAQGSPDAKAAVDFTDQKGNIVCPVTGETIADKNSKTHQDYKGKRYYFCCGACPGEFAANPAKYAEGKAIRSGEAKPMSHDEGKTL